MKKTNFFEALFGVAFILMSCSQEDTNVVSSNSNFIVK